MSDNRTEYVVTLGGVEHTMLLTADDAGRYGDAATRVQAKAVQPQNKARTPLNKSK